MKNKFTIVRKELFYILVNLITVKMFFVFPRGMVQNSGNASWLESIYVSLCAIGIYLITINLYKKSANMGVLDVAYKIGKKPLKIIVGVVIAIILLTNSAITLRGLPESLKSALLPLTPMQFILILLGIAVGVGAYVGIYSNARIHSLFVPIALIIFAMMLLLLIPHINLNNLFPIFNKGTHNIFVGGLRSLDIFSDVLVLYILLPFFESYKRVKDTGLKAIILGGVIVTLIMFFYNLVFSYPVSEEFILPVYQMTRLIKVGDFFARLEAFFEFFWTISAVLYASLYVFVVCYVLKESFDLKNYKPLVFPVSIIFIAISYLPTSTAGLSDVSKRISYFTIPVCIILPLLLGAVNTVKSKKSEEEVK